MNLLSSVKRSRCQWRNCQFRCSLANANAFVREHLAKETQAALGWDGPRVTLMESVSDSLVRNIYTSCLLEVILLLLFLLTQRSRYRSCFWVDALPPPLSGSPLVTAGLLVSPSSMYGCATLEELDYLCNLIGLRVLPHATSRDKATSRTQLEKNQSGRIRREQLSEATTCKTIQFLRDVCGSGVEPAPCYRKVAGLIPLVCMSKGPWARY